MTPSQSQLQDAMEATWPAASIMRCGPWDIREGKGGGKRVSAATWRNPAEAFDLSSAEGAMRDLGQQPLFMLRPGEDALDRALETEGYAIVDPVYLYAAPVEKLATERPPRVTTFEVWEPLAIMTEIWAAGGIGPERIAVMRRATGPKTGLLGRMKDQPAATGFVAMHDRIAMIHALEVKPQLRGQGMGRWMMRAAAFWAVRQGAQQVALAVTQSNHAGNALYASLGMSVVGSYHYRAKP